MRWFVLALALGFPEPLLDLDGVRNPDGTVTLNWVLPADPSVVGVTIVRQRLAGWDEDLFEIDGPAVSFLDATAHEDRSYGYWAFTRDATGDLGPGLYVEVWSATRHEDIDPWCYAAAPGPRPASGAILGVLALLGFLRPRRSAGGGPISRGS